MPARGTTDSLRVEILYALPMRQLLLPIEVEAGTTVQQAIDCSSIADSFPGEGIDTCTVGIWGQPVDRQQAVRAGDRIEIYRGLAIDPRHARRRLARAGKTLGQLEPDG
jgi:putative ubiquitin-RnfH superfamily antitoxin RatB of RatAB toxin-antitoxin module